MLAYREDDGKGIASDILTKHLEPKPYMYLNKPGVNTIKKKLEARDSMTFTEYILAYVKMIRDPRADQMGNIRAHLEHIQHLAEDAMARDWSGARGWSQQTLDDIEKGTYTWDDWQLIQLERMKHAINTPRNPQSGIAQKDDRVLPCRDFNGERGCTHSAHHGTAPSRFMHVCSYCYAQTSRLITTHGKIACIRRDVDNGVHNPRVRVGSKNGL